MIAFFDEMIAFFEIASVSYPWMLNLLGLPTTWAVTGDFDRMTFFPGWHKSEIDFTLKYCLGGEFESNAPSFCWACIEWSGVMIIGFATLGSEPTCPKILLFGSFLESGGISGIKVCKVLSNFCSCLI